VDQAAAAPAVGAPAPTAEQAISTGPAQPASTSAGLPPDHPMAPPAESAARHAAPETAPIDLLSSAGPAVLKRLAPVAVLALAVLIFVILRRRR